MIKFDQQRVQNLTDLRWQIRTYYKQNEVLPEDLSANQFNRFEDPVTSDPYEYRVISEDRFEICATFALKAEDNSDFAYYPKGEDEWNFHEAGYQCFEIRIEDSEKEFLEPVLIR